MAIYSIETITNLHMGDMGTSYDIVDKVVQKDALTKYPTIYATSLKGAVRSAAEKILNPEEVSTIFGGEKKSISKGTVSFNDAHLLLYPVRAAAHPYYLATCPAMLEDAIRLCSLTGDAKTADMLKSVSSLAVNTLYGANTEDWVEEWVLNAQSGTEVVDTLLEKLAPGEKHLVIFSDERMGELLEALPVVARNQLNNGISDNLWYEEFVPRRSIFITGIFIAPDAKDKADKEKKINRVLLGDDGSSVRTIQMGANATVGYGVCRFTKL